MIEIIPAIDIIDGQCVRLRQGDYAEKRVYDADPVAVAMKFKSAGVRHIHVVDLDGARYGRVKNIEVLAAIAQKTGLEIDFGGGVRTTEDLRQALENGADQVTAGSVAVRHRDLVTQWVKDFGANRIILGADSLDGRIATDGWQRSEGPKLFDFIAAYAAIGIKTVIATEISRDGMMQGPAFDLYARLKEAFPGLYVVASGGVSSVDDVRRLNELGVDAVIIGKALYENRISLDELKDFLC